MPVATISQSAMLDVSLVTPDMSSGETWNWLTPGDTNSVGMLLLASVYVQRKVRSSGRVTSSPTVAESAVSGFSHAQECGPG